ncbi:lectin BRA-3 isoform X2 [Ictalurus punctatus]|uniref:Lectin BRA-3 isoform X1 n=1 Tax=Ictalurus punctatus TaxID=7998 RepID=A0A2D0RK16_ICTPU|nr:lectin BRA-3 isoform X1 [Ictalurus punctatus]XP_047013848.1 lectin BRA-3 isoform X2 [Ictalurus punctatus]
MAVLSFLLLLALTDAATGLSWRQYIYCDTPLSWTDAQTHCRATYVDLAVIDTQWEFDSFVNQTSSHKSDQCWIGLRKNKREPAFTQWSDGKVLDFNKWKNGQPDHLDTEDCAFTNNNEWENKQCTEIRKFFCYTWAPQIIVVQEMKNWHEALLHCRTHYTDLVSLTTETDHFLAKNRSKEILTPTFWTSLRFIDGSWFWVNQDYMPSPTSMPSCPAWPYRCGARNIIDGVWENRDCEEKMNFICYHYI